MNPQNPVPATEVRSADAGLVRPLLALESLHWIGSGLVRPECVLACVDGSVIAADWRGGACVVGADGRQRLWRGQRPDGRALKPNGIAPAGDGGLLLAQLGDDDGGIWHLAADGRATPWLVELDGLPLPPTNFVLPDGAGGAWVTVSTRRHPRTSAWHAEADGGGDGFIVHVDVQRRARIVADGLGYTNEVALHPTGRWLYANETFGCRLSRFALLGDGRLGPREDVVRFGAGTFPDGLAFDVEGGAWVVSIFSNRLLHVAPDGTVTLWLEDTTPEYLVEIEAAFQAGVLGSEHMQRQPGRLLANISSIVFTGADRRTAVLGCLDGDRLATLRLPVAGHAPLHPTAPTFEAEIAP
jgi:sugar lactone lactonase YvrE